MAENEEIKKDTAEDVQETVQDKAEDIKDKEQKPEEQKPEEQKPEERKPEERKSEEQKPEEQKPEEQEPEEQKPEEQEPEERKSEEQEPEERKSEEQESEERKSEEQESEEQKPGEKKAEPKKEKKKSRNPFKSKKFKRGTLSIVLTVMFIAAVVLVNVILSLILDRFSVEADLTTGSIFTLDEETEEYIRGVDDDVTFYVTAERETLNNAGNNYKQTVEYLDKMTVLNRRFKVQYVNLLTDPDFSNGYEEDLQNYEVIVQSGKTGRYRILKINDFMRYTLSDGKTYSYDEASMYVQYYGYSVADYSSIAEEQIVSAIQSVSLDDPTVVTFLTGYGESDSKPLEEILTANAYVTQSADIDRIEAVPENTDILVIHGATKDYSKESITKVDEWLSNGGKYGKDLVYIASADAAETPNLDEYLKEWGIEIGKGYVLQTDTDHAYYTGSAFPLMQDLEIKTDTDYYSNMKIASAAKLVAFPLRPVIPLWDEESNMANKVIASAYGEKCILYPFSADESWSPTSDDLTGFDAVVEASKVQFEGGLDPVYSKIIVVGSDQLFASYYTTASNYSNGELALTIFDTNSGNNGDKIKIVGKSFTAETYQIDRSTQLAIGITFVAVIPVIIIVIGIVVWARRRRL